MTPTRRKPEKKTKIEKSIGATGALSSNDALTPASGGSSAPSGASTSAAKPAATPASGGSSAPSAASTSAVKPAATTAPKSAPAKRPSVASSSVSPAPESEKKPMRKLRLGKDEEKDAQKSQRNEGGEDSARKRRAEGDEKSANRPSATKASAGSRVLGVFLVILLALLALVVGAFSWYRWLYGSDELNIQGTWYVNGSDATIVINETEIALTDDVSYEYTIDPSDKSITYAFNDLSGVGHYRFSLDRGELAIIDGECVGFDSVKSDLSWLLSALILEMQGKEAAPAEGEQAMLLTREPVKIVTVKAGNRLAGDGEKAGEASGSKPGEPAGESGSKSGETNGEAGDKASEAGGESGGKKTDAASSKNAGEGKADGETSNA